ncbi:MAG TPA: hypothetical protein VEU54_07590 [Steroidobacteraceae bacterium]|nr:hypothetical protein [Steroidobacteraceae bacterium]
MRTLCTLLLSMALALGTAAARAPPDAAPAPAAKPASPPPQDLQPAVDTTATSPSGPAPAAAAPPPRAPAAAPRSGVIERGAAADGGAAAGERRAAAATKAGARAPRGPDRVQLDTTDITGNRELPKVLYIVPWRHSDLGDLVGKPPKSLLDEVLEPIDRDVFLRENRYYDALKPGAAGQKPGTAQGSEGKP